MGRIIFLLMLVLSTSILVAQSDHGLRNYNAYDGLPHSVVNKVLEDNNGYLWIATNGGGLARFDGKDFKIFATVDGLLSNIVIDLKADSENNLWIIHPRGVTRFDGISFKTFHSSDDFIRIKIIKTAFIVKDTLFVVSAMGEISKIHNDSAYYWDKAAEKGKTINRVFSSRGGDIYLVLKDGAIILKTPAETKQIGVRPDGFRIYSVYNDGDEVNLLLGNVDQMVRAMKVNTRRALVPAKVPPFKNPVLYYDATRQDFWLDGWNDLLLYHAKTHQTDTILKDVRAIGVYPDQEGNIWIGTSGKGLYKYFHKDFTKVYGNSIQAPMTILEDDEKTTWIGTQNGLWKSKGGKLTSLLHKTDSYKKNINCLAEGPDGALWIGTAGGVGKYDRATDQIKWFEPKDGLLGPSIFNIFSDKAGNQWIGGPAGLNRFDGKKFQTFTTEQGLLTNHITTMYYSRQMETLFMGNEFGINILRDDKMEGMQIQEFHNTEILCIQPFRDSLLLLASAGAGYGIFNPRQRSIKFITTRNGLASDFVYFITADGKNTIWVGTDKGISKMLLDDKQNIVENLHFDQDNGLDGIETNQNSFLISGNRKLFGLVDGVYQYNETGPATQRTFDLHLTDLAIQFGEESSRSYAGATSGLFKIPDHPVFPYDKNHLTFSFNKVDKQYPKSVKFKYILRNFDKDWSLPSTTKQVTYSLPPGEYEFEVMATNAYGSWSARTLKYPFTIKSPFYHTTSFLVIFFISLIALIVVISYYRVRQRVEKSMQQERVRLKDHEKIRKDIARDFHDDMGNQLTRIINYISLLKMHKNGDDLKLHQDLYTKVEESAKYLFKGTRDFIWSIDPFNDELSKTFIYIRDFGEKLFEEKNIEFRAFNEVKYSRQLPYGYNREINLIFKEAMTNAFKYSNAKKAQLSLSPTPGGFEISFEDDGSGFNLEEIEKSNGLQNIHDRAEKIKAILNIDSQAHNGTRISLSFHLN